MLSSNVLSAVIMVLDPIYMLSKDHTKIQKIHLKFSDALQPKFNMTSTL